MRPQVVSSPKLSRTGRAAKAHWRVRSRTSAYQKTPRLDLRMADLLWGPSPLASIGSPDDRCAGTSARQSARGNGEGRDKGRDKTFLPAAPGPCLGALHHGERASAPVGRRQTARARCVALSARHLVELKIASDLRTLTGALSVCPCLRCRVMSRRFRSYLLKGSSGCKRDSAHTARSSPVAPLSTGGPCSTLWSRPTFASGPSELAGETPTQGRRMIRVRIRAGSRSSVRLLSGTHLCPHVLARGFALKAAFLVVGQQVRSSA